MGAECWEPGGESVEMVPGGPRRGAVAGFEEGGVKEEARWTDQLGSSCNAA